MDMGRQPRRGDGDAPRRRGRNDAAAEPRHAAHRRSRQRAGLRRPRPRAPAPGERVAFLERNPAASASTRRRATPSSPTSAIAASRPRRCSARRRASSVFQDGVRINEPFGDIVNWDLSAASAIAGIQLMPGVNPAVRAQHAGRRPRDLHQERRRVSRRLVDLSGGSFGRLIPASSSRAACHGPLGLLRHRQRSERRRLGRAQPELECGSLFGKVGHQTERRQRRHHLTARPTTGSKARRRCRCLSSTTIRQAYTFPDRQQEPARVRSRSRAATS